MAERRISARLTSRALAICIVFGSAFVAAAHAGGSTRPATDSDVAAADTNAGDSTRLRGEDSIASRVLDSLDGLSGKLQARFVADPRSLEVGVLSRLFGGPSVNDPAVVPIADSTVKRPFSLVTLLPFAAKTKAGKVGDYRMGFWPAEKRPPRSPAYANPPGFIEVTPENQNTYVSAHFRLRDFLTKDQPNVWPKYLVLRESLLDKLELIIDDLAKRGVSVKHMTVMSGFRTPQYNQKGVGAGGRASDSRHQYGDAADVFVDNDQNGRMDDLNRDGRVDHRDAQVILDAAERVERTYPTLLGGGGLYRATAAHGPFAHVDVRGTRARW